MAFEYCQRLRLWFCVRVCVCVFINQELVRTITHRSFKLGSPNLDQRCKAPWFRSLLVSSDDRHWPSRSNLAWKSNFTPFWACPHHNSSAFQARSTKFGPKRHLSTVKIPINFGLGFDLHFHFQCWNSFIYQIYLQFFIIFSETRPPLVNIGETMAGNRSNQFGLLIEHKFCRKLSGNISIDSRYCNRFINLGRPIFSLNHSGASVATVFTIPTTFRTAHARCYTRAERATQSATRVGSPLFDALKVYLQSDLSCLYKLNCNLFNHQDLMFFCIGHQQSAISSCWLW